MKPSSSLRNARSAPLVLVSTARERAHEAQWPIRWLMLLTSTLVGFSLRQTITSSAASSRQALCGHARSRAYHLTLEWKSQDKDPCWPLIAAVRNVQHFPGERC